MTSASAYLPPVLALLFACPIAQAQQITLTPMLHSVGYHILLPSSYDPDSTATTVVRYRANGQDWQPGFPAARLSIGEFQGSLFQLEPDTPYELEVSLVDSFPALQKDVLTATTRTLAVPIVKPAGTPWRWVSPTGSGTVYSSAHPGNLKVLLASGLTCGTTVLLKGGVYKVGDMKLHITEDCPPDRPITIMAAPGETPILDGGSYDKYTWFQGDGDTTIWWTNLPAHLEYNAMCIVDGERMYPYAFLTPPSLFYYPNLWTLDYGLSGFYRNRFNRAYIKTLDGRNINHSQVIFSEQFICLTVEGNHKNVHLRIKGIQFKHYGKGQCHKNFLNLPSECYVSNTLRFNNASHVVVDSCSFEFCNFPVIFEGNCNNNIVMNCHITDGTGYWSHVAIKQTADVFNPILDPDCGSWGRYLENIGIHFGPKHGQTVWGNIAWNNTVQGVVNGIGFGTTINDAVMRESDICNNRISWCFDGINAVHGQRNVRIWGNDVSHCPIGTSLISSEQKPVYIFRNVYHHLDQRQNYPRGIGFKDCNGVDTYQSWSTVLKLNAGNENDVANDLIYFVHNTVHSIEPYAFNLYLWASTWKVLYMSNNIFYAEGDANFFFDQVNSQPHYSFKSSNDNIVNPGSNVPGIVRVPPTCLKHGSTGALQSGLASVTGSPWIRIENALNELPYFISADKGDFRLQPSSPLIDRGIFVPGFSNNFFDAAPDVGAFERMVVSNTPVQRQEQSLTVFPNPAEGPIFIQFPSAGGAAILQVWNAQGQLVAEQHLDNLPAGTQTLRLDTPAWPSGIYLVRLQQGDVTAVGRLVKKKA